MKEDYNMANKQPDPDKLPEFTLPTSFINLCNEFSDDCFIFGFKGADGEFRVIKNFKTQTDFFSFMTQMQIFCGTNLGYSAQMMSENIIDDLSSGFHEEDEE